VGQLRNKNLNKIVGRLVSEARHNAGFATSADFAAKCGIDNQTIRAIECGRATVNATTLRTFAENLDVSVDYLLGVSEVKTPDPDIQGVAKTYGLLDNALVVLESLNDELLKAEQRAAGIEKKKSLYDEIGTDRFYERLKSLKRIFSALNTILSDCDLAEKLLNFMFYILDINLTTIRKESEVSREESEIFNSFKKEAMSSEISLQDAIKFSTVRFLSQILKRAEVLDKPTKAPKTDA